MVEPIGQIKNPEPVFAQIQIAYDVVVVIVSSKNKSNYYLIFIQSQQKFDPKSRQEKIWIQYFFFNFLVINRINFFRMQSVQRRFYLSEIKQ